MMLCYLNNDGHSQLDTCIQYNIKPEWFNDDLIREAMRDIEHVYKILCHPLAVKMQHNLCYLSG